MELTMNNGFCEMTEFEMYEYEGGILDFVADIYDSWCNMWYEFGGSLYNVLH
uniref:hypothetical protein n=1 Tax=Agathobacter sp. TaxID=2021311 RepID=UPI0040564315